MNRVGEKKRIFDFVLWSVTAILILGQLIKLGNLPGLYLDAINPDYAAVQILFPHEHQIKWMISWPWLTQLYHGNVTILFTLVSILITGATSVLQHHIVYGILAHVCVMLLYRLLTIKEIGVSRYIAASVIFCTATLPALIGIVITQYYIEIFGTTCILLGLIFYYRWKGSKNNEMSLMFCYALFGIAFYSYFNFLFFLPSLVLGTIRFCRLEKLDCFRIVFQGAISYLLGCSVYFIGYTQIMLTSICDTATKRNIYLLLFVIGLYVLLALLLWLSMNRNKLFKIAISIFGGATIIWFVSILPAVSLLAKSLNINGKAMGILQRIYTSYKWLSMLVTGESAEILIYESSILSGNSVIWIAVSLFTIVLFLNEIFRKKIFRYSLWKEILEWICSYFLCTIVLSSRMQPQHFVPLLFMIVLLFALELNEVKKIISENKYKWRIKVTVVALVLLIGNNLVNEARIIHHIQETGGIGKYSSQINFLAADALRNVSDGKKEIYVFCEWGFLFGFNYLTQNRVEVTTELDANYVSKFVESGYRVIVCYWDQKNETMYEEFLSSWGSDITKTVRYQGNNEAAFYMMSIEGKLADS